MGNSCPVRSGGMKIHTKKGSLASCRRVEVPGWKMWELESECGEGKATPVSRDPASHHQRNGRRSHPESSHTSASTGEKMEWYCDMGTAVNMG
jgi:hypothetical protein